MFWFLLCRNRAKSGKFRQDSSFQKIWCDPHHPWCESHHSTVRPCHATLTDSHHTKSVRLASYLMRVASSIAARTEQSVIWNLDLTRCLFKELPWQDLDSFIIPHFQIRSRPHWRENREQEKRIHWRLLGEEGEEVKEDQDLSNSASPLLADHDSSLLYLFYSFLYHVWVDSLVSRV